MPFTELTAADSKAWKCIEHLAAAQKPDVFGRLDFVRRFCVYERAVITVYKRHGMLIVQAFQGAAAQRNNLKSYFEAGKERMRR